MHWLTMTRVKVIDAQRLYKEFSAMLEFDDVAPVDALVPIFVADARLYRRLEEGEVDDVASAFFERLRMLNTFVVLPLVLFLVKQPPAVLPRDRRDRCLAMLESYLMRRMLCRAGTQAYNRFFVENLLKDVEATPGSADEVILRALRGAEGDATLWPTDGHLDEAMTTSRAYGTGAIAGRRLLAVLWEVERTRLRSGKSEHLEQPSNLQIEHVMPQKWRKHWPVAEESGPDRELKELERDDHVQRLGNMTIVTGKLNPSMSNAAWPTKREELNKHSVLLLNNRLVSENSEAWDEQRIDDRTSELLAHIKAIWPGPDSSVWE
jgi:hypothetical protein